MSHKADDSSNSGVYNTTPPAKHQQLPKKRRRYRHPIATFILYAIFFLLVFLLIKSCGGSGSGSESGSKGGSLREKEPQVAEITSSTPETTNYVSEGVTIENGHYLIKDRPIYDGTSCTYGGIGRHAGFRFLCQKA